MFKINLEMARAAHAAAAKNQYRSFGSVSALGCDLVFEAQIYPDPSQPLAIEMHVTKDGKLVEPFTTLTVRVSDIEPLLGDEIIVDVHNNDFLKEPVLEAGLFCDSGKRVPLPFGEAEIWRILPKFVRGFCGAFPELKPPPICLLPPWSFAVHPSPEKKTEIIRIDRGEPGYRTVARCMDVDETLGNVAMMNDRIDITDLDAEAMLNGSMFGWDTPGSDPAHLQRMRDKR